MAMPEGYKPPNRALVLVREETCWEMKLTGHTYAEIADALGVSEEGARKIYLRVEAKHAEV